MPKRVRASWRGALCLLACLAPGLSRDATGTCDTSPPTCMTAIQNSIPVVNFIFQDSYGRTAAQLPLHGTLFNAWPGCSLADFAGCAGQSLSPYDCPGEYTCNGGVAGTLANAGTYADGVDQLWWSICRISNHTLVGGCPQFGSGSCVTSGTPGNYFPWEGLVFDLGADANQVAVFGANDFALEPCESVEYTVYLTNDPSSRDLITDPAVDGVDGTKWNRASLQKLYTYGDVQLRPADPAGHSFCGDTFQYSVEMDSMVPLFALPAGANLRYAAVIAGNDGLDFAACAYDSVDAEIDSVAGLSEVGAGICADGLSTVEGADDLTWAAGGQTFSWSPLNGATQFDVFRGTIASPWFYNGSCLQSALTVTTASDSGAPPSGKAFYYLVAGRGACGDSLLGRRSDGTAIPVSLSCP